MMIGKYTICGKAADILVPVIKVMELVTGIDTRLTFTGSQTITQYIYPAVYREEKSLCRQCLRKGKFNNNLKLATAILFINVIFGVLISLIFIAVLSNFFAESISSRVSLVKLSFSIGLLLSTAVFSILLIIPLIKENREGNRNISVSAGLICLYLNKNRAPNDYKYLTEEQWEAIIESNKKTDSGDKHFE